MFTLDTLPDYGRVYAFVTATKVTFHDDNYGESYSEEHGWVNDIGDFYIEESRNDVLPLVSIPTNDENLQYHVSEALASLGAYVDNGDGTYYGQDETPDHDGNSYTYALHFKVKHWDYTKSQYVETSLRVI